MVDFGLYYMNPFSLFGRMRALEPALIPSMSIFLRSAVIYIQISISLLGIAVGHPSFIICCASSMILSLCGINHSPGKIFMQLS